MANGDMSTSVLNERYRLEALIGEGGMAKVYRALDTQLDRIVAVKILKPEFAADRSFVDRFRREAQMAAKLNHRNLVGVHDTGDEGDVHYIVMEYIEGRTLADFFAGGGRLTPMKATELVEQVAGALAYAHQQGVIHRDIKPGNIMVTREGGVKVTDFGIARLVTTEHTIEQTAAVLGTASYLSPEQARGEVVDERSDIYSLGCVLFEALTGRQLFSGDSPVAIAYKHVNEQPVAPSTLNPEVTPDLDAVVMRALSKNPVNRYQTANEFRHDLEALRNGGQISATPLMGAAATTQVIRPGAGQQTAVLPPEEEEDKRKKWIVGIIVGLIIVAGLAAAAWWLVSSVLDSNGSSRRAQIPTGIVGSTEGDARDQLTQAGFENVKVEREDDVPDDEFEVDDVSNVDPAEGTTIDVEREVTLTVLREPGDVEVPSVLNRSEAEATALLSAAPYNFDVSSKERFSSAPVGSVFNTNPPAGTPLAPGSPITLLVSRGESPPPEPATVIVPRVECKREQAAVNKIQRTGGLIAQASGEDSNPSCPSGGGRIARTSPTGDSTVEEGSTIRYWVTADEPPSPPPSSKVDNSGKGSDNEKGPKDKPGKGPKDKDNSGKG
ncbi:MAG: Stk1 family PASTA domain-containing Ser/Thr kinase [Actinomycetota bacterium]